MTNDPLHTALCETLDCELPILLAGMGGVARWELAAAIAEAGGFAMLGMVREDPALITSEVTALRAATNRPFAVNLIPAATDPALLDSQIQCCLDLEVRAFSFFWDVMPGVIARVKQAGCLVLHQVGTLEAALKAEKAGTDVLVAQGIEAGGHVHGRGAGFELAESIRNASRLPVAVAGGISTGEDLATAIRAGFDGVQCGTAFLATDESFAHDYHKTRVITATGTDTVLTDAFVLNWPKGAAVRVIGNSVTEALHGQYFGHDPATLPRENIAWDGDEPRLRFSTDSPLRTTSGDLEAMALFAGQGTGSITKIVPAGSRLRAMTQTARQILTEEPQRPG